MESRKGQAQSHQTFLYSSILAMIINIVSQNAKSAHSSEDGHAGMEDFLHYIETIS